MDYSLRQSNDGWCAILQSVMDTSRIAELLAPFAPPQDLPPTLLEQLQRYLELLLRWNARMNLTAVRAPEHIVTRHFGESLFAARVLLGNLQAPLVSASASTAQTNAPGRQPLTLADIGSGAGFPGIPIKLLAPYLAVTLIESHAKKATFLREALRTLALDRAQVFGGRAEQWGQTADLVTLRAVEKFARVLPVAASLVAPDGKLCLLIGSNQAETAQKLLPGDWTWSERAAIPQSDGRVVWVAHHGAQ